MAKNTKELARELYLKGFNIIKIAQILDKTEKTIKNYKASDGNWDEIRAREIIANARRDGDGIYQSFIDNMYAAIAEIKNSDIPPAQKANALSKVGDSFAKMNKIANLEDPTSYKLAIIKKVITIIIEHFKSCNKECLKEILELVESDRFAKKLEEIE